LTHIAEHPESYIGTAPVGDGHCVALVRHAAGLDRTGTWRRGVPVHGNPVAPGTVIATFTDEGTYGNETDGDSHAALLLEQTARGALRVVDQWVGRAPSERVIADRGGTGPAADDASRYHVVLADT
jgi:hypothetical protein